MTTVMRIVTPVATTTSADLSGFECPCKKDDRVGLVAFANVMVKAGRLMSLDV